MLQTRYASNTGHVMADHIELGASRVMILALVGITAAESITVWVDPVAGLVLHSVMLSALLLIAAFRWEQPVHRPALGLALVPLMRLLSMAPPLDEFARVNWYVLIGFPLGLAGMLTVYALRLTQRDIGLTRRGLPLQLVIGLTGPLLGIVHYTLVEPAGLAGDLSLADIWVPALVVLVFSGFVEEFIFRGLVQPLTASVSGRSAVIYTAVLYAVMHLGHKNVLMIVFAGGVGLFFGWIVHRTNSLIGVALAHGMAAVTALVVLPVL
ncbi:MAG: CPBP family intramembrane metalloprotease [Anaerolineae bacterium]|nr:CPBP family intramembrane metalloprotease [Anaerolineae bacterium]